MVRHYMAIGGTYTYTGPYHLEYACDNTNLAHNKAVFRCRFVFLSFFIACYLQTANERSVQILITAIAYLERSCYDLPGCNRYAGSCKAKHQRGVGSRRSCFIRSATFQCHTSLQNIA